jgi:hypothetical protein
VEGLKANLLSINQLCDNDLVVQFSKKEFNIFDSSGKWLMGGERIVFLVPLVLFPLSSQVE